MRRPAVTASEASAATARPTRRSSRRWRTAARIQRADHLSHRRKHRRRRCTRTQQPVAKARRARLDRKRQRPLRDRRVHRAFVRPVQPFVLHVADDTDDRRPRALVHPPPRKRLPTALLSGKKRFAQARSTTTTDGPSASPSRSFNRRPSRRSSPSTPKYSGDTATHGATGSAWPGTDRRLFQIEVVDVPHVVRRASVGERDASDARQGGDFLPELVPERGHRARFPILCRRQEYRAGEQVVRVEADVDAFQLVQAGEEQARDDEKRCRDRELTADEQSSQAPDAAVARVDRPNVRSDSSTGPPVPCRAGMRPNRRPLAAVRPTAATARCHPA